MTEYNELFKQSKGMRQLEWLTNLGSVEIEVELDEGGTKTFNVTPAQATLLVKFHEKGICVITTPLMVLVLQECAKLHFIHLNKAYCKGSS